jgi:dipeptidase
MKHHSRKYSGGAIKHETTPPEQLVRNPAIKVISIEEANEIKEKHTKKTVQLVIVGATIMKECDGNYSKLSLIEEEEIAKAILERVKKERQISNLGNGVVFSYKTTPPEKLRIRDDVEVYKP